MNQRNRQLSLKVFHQGKPDQKQEIVKEAQFKSIPKFLPTISENREVKKMQAKQLTFNVNKFQNLVNQVDIEKNQEEIVRNAVSILKNFGEVDNNFKDLFVEIYIKVKNHVFLTGSDLQTKYGIKQGMSYRKACKTLDKIHSDYIAKKQDEMNKLRDDFEKQRQLRKKQNSSASLQIKNLKLQVEKFKLLSNTEYVRALQKKIADLKQALSDQIDEYRILAKKNEQASLQIESLRKEVQQNLQKIGIQQSNLYDLSILKEKTEIYLLNIKDRFDELMSRMIGLKEIIQKVECQNQNLIAERVKLTNRAAISFEELTPRPKYSEQFKLDDANLHFLPTQTIFKNLADFYEWKEETFLKFFVSKKNRKLQECQKIRQSTVNEIIKAKQELHNIV